MHRQRTSHRESSLPRINIHEPATSNENEKKSLRTSFGLCLFWLFALHNFFVFAGRQTGWTQNRTFLKAVSMHSRQMVSRQIGTCKPLSVYVFRFNWASSTSLFTFVMCLKIKLIELFRSAARLMYIKTKKRCFFVHMKATLTKCVLFMLFMMHG